MAVTGVSNQSNAYMDNYYSMQRNTDKNNENSTQNADVKNSTDNTHRIIITNNSNDTKIEQGVFIDKNGEMGSWSITRRGTKTKSLLETMNEKAKEIRIKNLIRKAKLERKMAALERSRNKKCACKKKRRIDYKV